MMKNKEKSGGRANDIEIGDGGTGEGLGGIRGSRAPTEILGTSTSWDLEVLVPEALVPEICAPTIISPRYQ